MPSILVNGGGDGENRILELRTFVSFEGPQRYMRWVRDPFELNLITNVVLSANFVNSTGL